MIIESKMAGVKKYLQRKETIWSMSVTIFLLSFYFIYLLVRINPKLIYQSQEPVFFFDKYFIGEFFNYPGGINELISSFLSQFFYHAWTGALVLTLIFWLVTWNTKLFIQSINNNRPIFYLHWVPSVFLLALHSDYRFPLLFTSGILWTLLCVNLYIRVSASNSTLRFLFYIILYTALFYISAGQALVFSIIIIIFDALQHRRIILLLLYIVFAGMLPYLAASTFFIVSIKDMYTTHLTSYDSYYVPRLSLILYSIFPLILLLVSLRQRYIKIETKNSNSLRSRLFHGNSIGIRMIQGIILLIVVGMTTLYSYDKRNEKVFLLVDYHARFREWDKVLDVAKQYKSGLYPVQYQINRALYHSGRLLDEMFSFAQRIGINGLFMHHRLHPVFPLQNSDVFFDLGLINETEHWAYEAVSVSGDTPWNLQQLTLINLLKKNRRIAERFLGLLLKTMWHKSWAKEYFKYLSDMDNFSDAPELKYKKSIMPETDFLISPTEPQQCLFHLLENRKNKMAFEYFMAYCLLQGNLSQIIKNIHRLNDFDYPRIPRHLEEAILIHIQLTGRKDIALQGKQISNETIHKFIDFNEIMKKYNKNKNAAYDELNKKYKDTYWFYAFYYYKPMGN
jgi:hypothetical protein